MDIKVIVTARTSEHETFNDIHEDVILEDNDIINLAIVKVLEQYNDIMIDRANCHIDGISGL